MNQADRENVWGSLRRHGYQRAVDELDRLVLGEDPGLDHLEDFVRREPA